MKKRLTVLMECVVVLFFLSVSSDSYGQRPRSRISDLTSTKNRDSDVRAELLFGRSLAARILSKFPLLENDRLNDYVNLVGKAISLSAGRPEITFFFGVVDSKELNAYAIPGGYVFVTTSLIDILDNEAQLACLLGHEIIHIVERHVVKEIGIKGEDGSAISGLSALIGGTTGSFTKTIEKSLDEAENILLRRGYQKKDELSADSLALTLAAISGYDPMEYISLLKRIQHFEPSEHEKEKTHPFVKERIRKLYDLILSNKLERGIFHKGEKRFHDYTKK